MPAPGPEQPTSQSKFRYAIGRRALLGIAIVTIFTGCAATLLYGSIEPGAEFASDPDGAQRHGLLSGVSSWSRLPDMAGAGADRSSLLVIDHAPMLSLKQSATQKAVADLQNPSGGKRRPVLATIVMPGGAGGDGGTAVWALIDDVLARNFDGVFLDSGAAFALAQKRGAMARGQLATAVADLIERARLVNPHFLLILENAPELTADLRVHRLIDGVATDNLLFGIDGAGTANNHTDIISGLHDLNRIRKSGRPVFVTEFLSVGAGDIRAGAMQTLATLGFIGRIVPTKRAG